MGDVVAFCCELAAKGLLPCCTEPVSGQPGCWLSSVLSSTPLLDACWRNVVRVACLARLAGTAFCLLPPSGPLPLL